MMLRTKMIMGWTSAFMLMSILFSDCSTIDEYDHTSFSLEIRDQWPEPPIPDKYPFTIASVDLGRTLFFDTRLSEDGTISCASCHKEELAFADDVSISPGVYGRLGFRNAPSLGNVVYLPYLNKDGAVKNLDIFSATPFLAHDEMSINMKETAIRLRKEEPKYQSAAQSIYQRDFDTFVMLKSIGAYLRTFISDDSPYDQYYHDGIKDAMSYQALTGMALFNGKAKCNHCHSGFLFSDHSFKNNGIYQNYEDMGRQRVTLDEEDHGKFRVAPLRNVALTAPYMHDGSFETLEDVLDHYGNGGDPSSRQDEIISTIQLTQDEQSQIIAFLKSLTDSSFRPQGGMN